MASNGSDGAYEDAMGEFKFGERTFEDVDPVASGETAAPDTLFAVESTLAKEAERATYQAYSIRPTKGPIDNAEDDDRRWETTESTLEMLDADQFTNGMVRLGQTEESLVIGSQFYSSMLPNQKNGIEKLLNELRQQEPFCEFSFAELKVKEVVGDGVKRTEAITILVKRYPGGQIVDGSTNNTEAAKPESESERVVQVNDSCDDPPAKTEIDVKTEVDAEVERDDRWETWAAKKKKMKNNKYGPLNISEKAGSQFESIDPFGMWEPSKKKKQNDPPKSFLSQLFGEFDKRTQDNSSHEALPAKLETSTLAEAKSEDETWGDRVSKKEKKRKNRQLQISKAEHHGDWTFQPSAGSQTREERDKEKSQPYLVPSIKVEEVKDEDIVYVDDFWGSSRKNSKGWDRFGTRGGIQLLDPKTKSLLGSGKVNYDAWWDWITPNDTNTQPQQHFLECWIYSETDEAAYSIQNIKDHAVSYSIRQAPPTHNGLEPTGGLRLFHCKAENDEPPFAGAGFKQIAEAFSLPPIYRHVMSRKSGFIGELKNMKGDPVFVCKKTDSSATITAVLMYDQKKNETLGYVASGLGVRTLNSSDQLLPFCKQFAIYRHPVVILILILELMIDKMSSNLEGIEQRVRKVELETGYSNQQRQSLDSIDQSSNHTEILDYRALAQDLGAETCRFVLIRSLILNATMLQDFVYSCLTGSSCVNPPGTEESTMRLIERVRIAESTLKHMQTYGAIEGRLQAQQNVLFNLIAQQDNALNIEVARDSKEIAQASKRDSSAMKVIAVLTTVFLPGTFVSSFFAMPILDWSAVSPSEIVTNHFWVYWAVTVPLTLLTMLVVSFWIVIRGKKNEAISKAARKSVGFEGRESENSSLSDSHSREKREGNVIRGLKYVRDGVVELVNFQKPEHSDSGSHTRPSRTRSNEEA